MNMFNEPVRESSRKRAQRKQQAMIQDTASKIFKEVGYKHTTIREIAKVAGVSTGSVMLTGSKDDLLVQTFANIIYDSQTPKRSYSTVPLSEAVERLLCDYFSLITQEEDLAKAWAIALISDPKYRLTLAELHDSLIGELQYILSSTQNIEKIEGLDLAETLYTCYLGHLLSWSTGLFDRNTVLANIHITISTIFNTESSQK